MKFKTNIVLLSGGTLLLGIYALQYGVYCLWDYRDLVIPKAIEKDAHGMSRIVGYTFVFLLGVVLSALSFLIYSVRNVSDTQSQDSIGLCLLLMNSLACAACVYLQTTYWGWDSGWGRLYIGTFFVLAGLSAVGRFAKSRVPQEEA